MAETLTLEPYKDYFVGKYVDRYGVPMLDVGPKPLACVKRGSDILAFFYAESDLKRALDWDYERREPIFFYNPDAVTAFYRQTQSGIETVF